MEQLTSGHRFSCLHSHARSSEKIIHHYRHKYTWLFGEKANSKPVSFFQDEKNYFRWIHQVINMQTVWLNWKQKGLAFLFEKHVCSSKTLQQILAQSKQQDTHSQNTSLVQPGEQTFNIVVNNTNFHLFREANYGHLHQTHTCVLQLCSITLKRTMENSSSVTEARIRRRYTAKS